MSKFADYQAIKARLDDDVALLQLYRPEENNTINEMLIKECEHALNVCEERAKIVILEGLPNVFCFGADFKEMAQQLNKDEYVHQESVRLYHLWQMLNHGPFVSIAKVQGQANAGGVGFVAACDVVLAQESALFSLSELLFSLMPACVLPFLIQKVGWQKAHYLTLMTQPISALRAREIGLVDEVGDDVDELLRKHLMRLKRLKKKAIMRYKRYMSELGGLIHQSKDRALNANLEVFEDKKTLRGIERFITTGVPPWEDI